MKNPKTTINRCPIQKKPPDVAQRVQRAAFRGRVPPYSRIPCGSGIEPVIGGLSRLNSGTTSRRHALGRRSRHAAAKLAAILSGYRVLSTRKKLASCIETSCAVQVR
ncbi:hypothetical protein [Paraburkholderia hospita]|uniref:hypothetical protein n=1 Tax=Paraburkholderia hospita TaxID=169430 RepID=UPI001178725C|nr:hypothetical protein [Paraburkholderia hospita]